MSEKTSRFSKAQIASLVQLAHEAPGNMVDYGRQKESFPGIQQVLDELIGLMSRIAESKRGFAADTTAGVTAADSGVLNPGLVPELIQASMSGGVATNVRLDEEALPIQVLKENTNNITLDIIVPLDYTVALDRNYLKNLSILLHKLQNLTREEVMANENYNAAPIDTLEVHFYLMASGPNGVHDMVRIPSNSLGTALKQALERIYQPAANPGLLAAQRLACLHELGTRIQHSEDKHLPMIVYSQRPRALWGTTELGGEVHLPEELLPAYLYTQLPNSVLDLPLTETFPYVPKPPKK